MGRDDEMLVYCSECGRGLAWGEAWQKDGLAFCLFCKDIVGAKIP